MHTRISFKYNPLSHCQDVNLIAAMMTGAKVEQYLVPLEQWNHADFLWGIDAPSVVYQKVMETMMKYA